MTGVNELLKTNVKDRIFSMAYRNETRIEQEFVQGDRMYCIDMTF